MEILQKGRYQKKLYSVFLILGILVFVLPQLLFAVSYIKNYQKHYQDTVYQSVQSRITGTELSLSVITTALYNIIGNVDIGMWGASNINSGNYYFYAARSYNEIQKVLSGLSQLDYAIAVTSLDTDSFVISRNGTISKKRFFETETDLSGEQVEAIRTYFSHNSSPLTIPVYSREKNELSKLYYLVVRKTQGVSGLLYIVEVPFDSLFSSHDPMMIIDDSGLVAYSNFAEQKNGLTEALLKAAKRPCPQEISTMGHQIYLQQLNGVGWKIAYVYNDVPFRLPQQLILLSCLTFTLLFVVQQFAAIITKKLYRPIQQVVEEVIGDRYDGGQATMLDEFQIIHQNADRLNLLTNELNSILHEKEVIADKQLYRDLLLGSSSPRAVGCEDRNYCVCLIEFSEEDDAKLFLNKSSLEVSVQGMKEVHYVSMGRERSAIVIEAENGELAKTMVLSILSKLCERADSCIAISDVVHGPGLISECYRQAVKILEYRYLYDKTEILTMNHIKNLDDNNYYYPLQTEKNLLNCMVEGDSEALQIYRDLVHENTVARTLSPDAQKNFRFALLGTLGRVFQELKTTPESLLCKPVDFEKLYGQWNSSTLLQQLESVVSDTVNAMQERSRHIDNEILREMTEYIHQNYSDDIMLNDMAQVFNISPKYCSMLFKRLSDDTFKNYLNRYRVECAKDFIEKNPNIKINELSRMVGYNSANSFIRVFSRYIGITPKAFADEVQKRQKINTVNKQ